MVYCSCSLVSKIYQIYHRSSLFPSQYTSGGSRGWAGGPVPPSYFLTKMRPEGPKKIFWETDPPDPPPPPPHLKVWIYHCNTPSINLISKSIYIKSIVHLPNLVSGQVGYEELAGGFKPIRNGKIF